MLIHQLDAGLPVKRAVVEPQSKCEEKSRVKSGVVAWWVAVLPSEITSAKFSSITSW